MPGVSGVTVVTNARVYYSTRAAAGASSARHSLRPLIFRGRNVTGKTRAKPAARSRSRALTLRGLLLAGTAPAENSFAPSLPRWADDGRTAAPLSGCPPSIPMLPDSRRDEKRPDPEPDLRVLPPGRYGGIDFRPPRGQ